MRFYFRKNNRKNDIVKSSKRTLWQKFEQANLRLQHKCAQWLERKTAHFTPGNWIVILFSFFILAGGCCIYLIVSSFSDYKAVNIWATSIIKPTNSVQLKEKDIDLNTIIGKAEFEKVTRFRRYMDSLDSSPTGKKMHDSIVLNRPGLLDSLTILENYYYSHLKN